jgi:LysR family transcriptional regulator (chromosome initiation inhibitor)
MRYLAAASPAFMQRYFADGVGAGTLAEAPSLVFNTRTSCRCGGRGACAIGM